MLSNPNYFSHDASKYLRDPNFVLASSAVRSAKSGVQIQLSFDWLTRQHFLTHEMEPDDFLGLTLVEMALDSVPHVVAKLLQRSRFRKNGLAKRASRVTALGRLFQEEYQFVRFVQANGRPLVRDPHSAAKQPDGGFIDKLVHRGSARQ